MRKELRRERVFGLGEEGTRLVLLVLHSSDILASTTTGRRRAAVALITNSATATKTITTVIGTHHGGGRLKRVGSQTVVGRGVVGHHVAPVVIVVGPGAGHLGRHLRRGRHAAAACAVRGVVVPGVGRGGAVGPLTVHGGAHAGGSGRSHLGCHKGASVAHVAVGRGHDGGRGRGARDRGAGGRETMTDTLLRELVV